MNYQHGPEIDTSGFPASLRSLSISLCPRRQSADQQTDLVLADFASRRSLIDCLPIHKRTGSDPDLTR